MAFDQQLRHYQAKLVPEMHVRSTLHTRLLFHHVCNGERPGGHFLQKEAWEAYQIALESTVRAAMEVMDDPEFVR